MRKDFFASIGLLLIAAVYYFSSTGISESSLDEPGVPGPKSLPTVLAAVLAIIAMTLGVRSLASSGAGGALFFWFVFAFMLGVRQPEGIFGF